MQKIKKYGILMLSIILGVVACQKGIEISSEYDGEFKEQRAWLRASSSIFAEEGISLGNQSGKKVKGKLNWQLASKSKNSKGEEIIVVPFTFAESVYKNKKVYNDVPAKEMPSIYSILIKKDKNGLFDGRLRIRSFNVDAQKGKRIFNNLYKLNGDLWFSFVREADGNDYTLYETTTVGAARTTECTVTTATNRIASCNLNGGYSTTCTYYNVTTSRYTCNYGSGGLPEEVQTFQPDEGGGGIYEYEESETEFENQNIIDSLQGYPCAQDILKQLPSIDQTVNDILQSTFGVNDNINMKFVASGNLASGTDGETQCRFLSGEFNCTVQLNSDVLEQATKDYIVATFIHEALHAYITHQRTVLDDSTFKQRYPIYWQYIGNNAQHNLMASNYVAMMASVIRGFNQNISESNASALAWGGLNMTTAWKNKADTNYVKQVNSAGRAPSDNNYVTYGFTKCQ